MKNALFPIRVALQALWILVASIVIAAISATSPNWRPVNYLITTNPLIGRSRKSLAGNVAYKWFNKNVWRSKPAQFTEGVSASREVQKTFFTDCQRWSKGLLENVRLGFVQQATEMPAYSWFIGWLLREAGDSYPGPTVVDETKVIAAKGTLQRPIDVLIAYLSSTQVRITWSDDSGTGNALATDGCMLAWYNSTQNTFGSELTGTVKRSAETWSYTTPGITGDDEVYYWFYLASANEQIVTDSDIATKVKHID